MLAVPSGREVFVKSNCVSHLTAGHQYCRLDIHAAITHEASCQVKTLSPGISVALAGLLVFSCVMNAF